MIIFVVSWLAPNEQVHGRVVVVHTATAVEDTADLDWISMYRVDFMFASRQEEKRWRRNLSISSSPLCFVRVSWIPFVGTISSSQTTVSTNVKSTCGE